MQPVTQEWKDIQGQTMAPPTTVRISLAFQDGILGSNNGTLPDASPIYGGSVWQDHSVLFNPAKKKQPISYMEQNYVVLNSPPIVSNKAGIAYGYKGGYLCDENGYFQHTTGLRMVNKLPTTIKTITIIWCRFNPTQYAKDFTLSFYNSSSSLIYQKVVTGNNSNKNEIEIPSVAGCNKIEVTIERWSLPYNIDIIDLFFFGKIIEFDDKGIISFKHKGSSDPLNFSLPEESIEWEIDNSNGEWNPENPTGAYSMLTEKALVIVDYGYTINGIDTIIPCGVFYMSDWDTPQNGLTATFKAQSQLYFLDDKMTVSAGTHTYHDIIDSSLYGVQREIGNTVGLTSVTFDEAVRMRKKDILQLACSAAMAYVYIDRTGKIVVDNYTFPSLPITSDYTITQFLSFKKAEYELTKDLYKVVVNGGLGEYHNNSHAKGETQQVQNDLIKDETTAYAVAQFIWGIMTNRNILTGEYRADPRMDCLDTIFIENKYAVAVPCVVTEYEYTFKGMIRGSYKARAIG